MSEPIESPTPRALEVGFASALRAGVQAIASLALMPPVLVGSGDPRAARLLYLAANGYFNRPCSDVLDPELAMRAYLLGAVGTAGGGQPNASDLGSVETQKGNTE